MVSCPSHPHSVRTEHHTLLELGILPKARQAGCLAQWHVSCACHVCQQVNGPLSHVGEVGATLGGGFVVLPLALG